MIVEPPCISVQIQAVVDAHDFIKKILNIHSMLMVYSEFFDKRLLQGSSQPQID